MSYEARIGVTVKQADSRHQGCRRLVTVLQLEGGAASHAGVLSTDLASRWG